MLFELLVKLLLLPIFVLRETEVLYFLKHICELLLPVFFRDLVMGGLLAVNEHSGYLLAELI